MIIRQEEPLQFLAATYLECVSNELRETVSNTFLKKSHLDFQNEISTAAYDKILDEFKIITGSDMIIMFQVSGGTPIKSETNFNQIVILSESEAERCIPILRSELLKYYHYETPKLLLKESIRIVNVASENEDSTVVSYYRSPCTIAFVEFGYGATPKENNRIYFAIFFKQQNNSYVSVSEILPKIQNFLLYRFDLISRINRDFMNNIYGIQKEEFWKNQWLSIEKAGAHADSKFIDDIIEDSKFKTLCINTLFFDDKGVCGDKDNKNVLQLISNILIARYFRLIFSSDPHFWRCFDHIDEDFSLLSDVVAFDGNLKFLQAGEKSIPIKYSGNILSKLPLFFIESEEDYGGVPCIMETTYSKKYLIAFLVDVFNNILSRGKRIVVTTESSKTEEPGFLVIKNTVDINDIVDLDWNTLDATQKLQHCNMLNYKLKQSIEFENAIDQSMKKGLSLGCLNHFMSYFGKMKVYYEYLDDVVWFCIKLPIIKNNQIDTEE